MLWAVLLITTLDREAALQVFRRMADQIFKLPDQMKFDDITLTGLAKLGDDQRDGFIKELTAESSVKAALSPLLLFPKLPAFSAWEKYLEPIPLKDAWQALARGVLSTLDHQSQESTDCRWLRVLAMLVAGHLHLPPEPAKEFVEYPNFGDMRKVRPSVRACEISFSVDKSDWPETFWRECMTRTPCSSLTWSRTPTSVSVGFTPESIATAWVELKFHFHESIETTAPDARHDTVFGMGFYALSLAGEILRGRSQNAIGARLALRTLVESYITLAYLLKADHPDLWKSYRAYGSGQAKLAFLKLNEADNPTTHVDLPTLERLVNEDVWMEFMPINVGHWEKSNLRDMSIKAGVKDVYDRFYSWTSSFSHAHWAAMRESVFDTCANPLHRMHRVPREKLAILPSVVPDMAEITDLILGLVSRAYPGKKFKISTTVKDRKPDEDVSKTKGESLERAVAGEE